ncbi:transmembrane protein 254-like [Mya arenaria]|uniref:transmembrane protein 254-like n=1 Tax=Mya arenaria TaxID=6604 RepID=UPI0022E44594|nr:transmembrane protein 254-like [Mya arenaria]XP_052784559.1 transmembrane protein 254-like [Mya arenaria]
MKGTKIDPSFYRLPRNPEWALVSALMFVFYLTLFHPDSIIVDYLGPVGTFMRYMNKEKLSLCYNILYATVVIHIAEAVYSFILCRRKGLNPLPTCLWTVQTFIFGFPSLRAFKSIKNIKQS